MTSTYLSKAAFRPSVLWLAVIFAVLLAACSGDTPPPTGKDTGAVVSVTDEQGFREVLADAGGRLVVVDLYADWCRPCRQLAPLLNNLATEYRDRAGFFKINVDANRQLAQSMGMRGIPYVVFIKNHTVVDTLTGLHPKATYRSIIQKHL